MQPQPVSGTGSAPAALVGMLAKIAELSRLRMVLREGAEQLATEAETHPESVAALEFLKLASKIKELERQVEVLTKELLKHEVPLGAA